MSTATRPSSSRLALLPLLLATALLNTVAAPRAAAQTWTPLAEVETLGTGTRGAGGVPELSLLGLEALGQPGAGLQLHDGRPRALAQIVLSLAQGPTPLPGYGAQLWPAAPFIRWMTMLDAAGDSPVFASGPAATPAALAGVDIFAQGLVLDAMAQGGAAFTAGLRVRGGAGSTGAGLFAVPSYFVDPVKFSSQHGNMPVSDLDGNGRPDVVVAAGSGANSSLCVLRQLQNGTLAPPLVFPVTAGQAQDLGVADLDGDGKADVLAALGSGLQLVLFPGLGNGALGAEQLIPTPAQVKHVAVGDVTGDGRADVVAAGWVAHGVAVLPGLPGGGLGAPIILSVGDAQFAVEVRLADADGDGLDDILLVINTPVSTVSKLKLVLSLGDGTFAPETSFSVHSGAETLFAVGDLNGDDFPDVVVARSNGMGVLLNDGHGAYAASVIAQMPTQNPTELALADLDGDGQDEILVASFLQGILVRKHLGDGVVGPAQELGAGGVRLTPADMDLDGNVDLVSSFNNPLSQVAVYPGAGDGSLNIAPKLPDFASTTGVAADLNGDGHLDVVGALVDGTLAVVLGDGRGQFGPAATVPAGGEAKRVAVGDLNADGVQDVVVTFVPFSLPGFAVLRGIGDGTFAAPELHAGTPAEDVQIADVTQDGRPDVVFVQVDPAAGLVVYPTLADGSLGAPVLTPPAAGKLRRLALGDIDGDGLLDAVANGTNLTVFLGTGSAAFQQGVSIPSSNVASDPTTALALGDLDADGDLDLVQGGTVNGVLLWFNDGAGHFTKGKGVLTSFVDDLTIADVNADGAADVVASGVWLSFGDGTLAPFQPGAVSGTPGDFDEDGDLDFTVFGYVFFNALQ